MANPVLAIGDLIHFASEKRPYRVRAANERFAVCTKPFNPRRTVLYTVIDFERRVRGTENLIFGAGAETDEQCAEMLRRLTTGDPDDGFRTEVSHRNFVDLDIVKVNGREISARSPVAEHGILFSAPMVQAILEGRKTVTRRLSKQWLKVKAGDILWGRETAQLQGVSWKNWVSLRYAADDAVIDTMHDEPGPFKATRWTPSIHMPRWASRITLECLEDAREELLQCITEEDAIAEGCEASEITDADIREAIENPISEEAAWVIAFGPGKITAKADYAMLWDSLHTEPGERWADNPSVVRIGSFKRVQ